MKLIAVIFAMWLLGCLVSALWLSRRGKRLSRTLSVCSKCGASTEVTPDAIHSRLMVSCQAGECGHVSIRPVRASALSMFGITQLVLTLLAAGTCLQLGRAMGLGPTGRFVMGGIGLVFGYAVARFLVMSVVHSLRRSKSPAWQEEVVAYLAPPPWRMLDPSGPATTRNQKTTTSPESHPEP